MARASAVSDAVAGAVSGAVAGGLAIVLAATLGCRAAPEPTRPLRIALHSPPQSLDPHRHNEVLTFGILRHVYEGLTGFDADMRVVPVLAQSWDNPSDLVWRFHLRPGVRFHDGRPVTAHDVVASVERARHPGAGQNFGSYLVAVQDVRATDAVTVEITTRQPYPILPNKLTFILIVPADAPDAITAPIGTGPYRLASFTPGEPLRLSRFDGYWGRPAAEADVELIAEVSGTRRLERLRAGDLDVVPDPTPNEAGALGGSPGVHVLERESLTVTYLLMNPAAKPFDDLRVRRAVDLALDRAAIVRRSELGRGSPLGQMVGRNTFGFDPALRPTVRDLAAARDLLSASGYPAGVDVDLELRSGRNAAEIARQLGEAGIRVRLVERPWAEMYPRLRSGAVVFYFGAFLDPSADASDYFDAVAHTRQPESGYGDNNHVGFSDPELDQLIERSGATLDMLNRREILALAMRRALGNMIYAPLYAPSTLVAVRDGMILQTRLDGLPIASEMRRATTPESGTRPPAGGRTQTQ